MGDQGAAEHLKIDMKRTYVSGVVPFGDTLAQCEIRMLKNLVTTPIAWTEQGSKHLFLRFVRLVEDGSVEIELSVQGALFELRQDQNDPAEHFSGTQI